MRLLRADDSSNGIIGRLIGAAGTMPRGMREDERVMVMVECRVYFLRLTFLAYWR